MDPKSQALATLLGINFLGMAVGYYVGKSRRHKWLGMFIGGAVGGIVGKLAYPDEYSAIKS